jgi:uncharacterized protein YdhG (YjbR/CyaY superfamily)
VRGSCFKMAHMRKAKAGKRDAARKVGRGAKDRGGAASTTNVDEYLARVQEPARGVLSKMRTAIRSAVPREATEVISYKIPAFKHRVVLVWYAAFADHCSLFPTAAVIEKFKNELKGFSTSKGTIHFPLGEPLPIALIKKLVKTRVARASES